MDPEGMAKHPLQALSLNRTLLNLDLGAHAQTRVSGQAEQS